MALHAPKPQLINGIVRVLSQYIGVRDCRENCHGHISTPFLRDFPRELLHESRKEKLCNKSSGKNSEKRKNCREEILLDCARQPSFLTKQLINFKWQQHDCFKGHSTVYAVLKPTIASDSETCTVHQTLRRLYFVHHTVGSTIDASCQVTQGGDAMFSAAHWILLLSKEQRLCL